MNPSYSLFCASKRPNAFDHSPLSLLISSNAGGRMMAGRYFRGNSKAEVNGSVLPFPRRLLKTPILMLLSWWNISRLGPDVILFLPIWLNFTRVLKICILFPSLEQRDFASIFLNHWGLRFVKLKGWCEWLRLKGWLLNTVWFGLPGKCCRWIGLLCSGRLISGKAFRAVLCSPHNSGLISSLKPHSGHDPACA